MNWLFPFSSAEKGKKRERSPSPEPEESSEDESVAAPAVATPIRNSTAVNAVPIASPQAGRAAAPGTPLTERRKLPNLMKYRSPSIFEERTTLAQKLAEAIPDADISSPRVIIVGGQTAGKTKLIISLVFYHLVDNVHFTDDMGEQLLKIFRTGTRMVTRRPTTIIFSKSAESKITLHLSGVTAVYPSPEFDAIVNQIIHQSKDADGHAYEDELRVYICAPGLPNQSFTDLPGLTTKDRQLKGSVEKSIASLVKSYMRDEASTVVVVEPATSAEDFETSQISPIMRDIHHHDRPDIFENSVLVLSKCDKIRDSLEYEVMEKIDLTSAQFKEFPYKHVVGVINKIEGSEDLVEGEEVSFSEFKQVFRATKEYERQRFADFLNRDGTPCNPSTQCTTSAVFHKMEQISFNMVYRSIQDGIYSIDQKIIELERRIKAELAPPLAFYDSFNHYSTNAQGDAMNEDNDSDADFKLEPAPSVVDHMGGGSRGSRGFSRMTLIKEFQYNWDRLLCHKYGELESFPDLASKVIFIDDTLQGWPEFAPFTNLTVSKHHKRVLQKVEKIFHLFIDEDVSEATVEVLKDASEGCFSKNASPFHRIDRFPALCKRIEGFIKQRLDTCLNHARKQITNHLGLVWSHIIPAGGYSKQQLCVLFDTLHHIAIRSMHEKLTSLLHPKSCFGLEDSLFVESEPFARLRQEIQHKPFLLSRQKDLLFRCKNVTSNEQLRQVLELHLAALKPSGAGATAAAGSSELSVVNNVSVKMEDGTHSNSSSTNGNGSSSGSESEHQEAHWLAFWTTAADEARQKAVEEEQRALEQEKRRLDELAASHFLSTSSNTAAEQEQQQQQQQLSEDDMLIAAAERAEEEYLSGSQEPESHVPDVVAATPSSASRPHHASSMYAAEGPTFADLAAAARNSSSSSSSSSGGGYGAYSTPAPANSHYNTSPNSRHSQNNNAATPSKRIKTEHDQSLVYAMASRVGSALFGTSASSYTTVPFSSTAAASASPGVASVRLAQSPVVDLTD